MYNSLNNLPQIPYNILTYLAKEESADDIWKMLAYNTYDALSKPSLTFGQKLDLVWKQGPQEKYGVFFTPLVEDMITESKSIAKIYQYYIHANDLFLGTVVYAFDFLYGGNMALVEYNGMPVSRGDLFIHKILSTLNGVLIGGVGKLMFADDMSRYDLARMTLGDSKKFTGVQLFMSVEVGDTGKQVGCGTD